MTNVAIIGAGFSGTLLALHLVRRSSPDTRITLIQRHGQFGPGTAYGTGNPGHLLNVPAGKMSAFHDHPDDFFDWLLRRGGAGAASARPERGTFVPRGVFGRYIRDLLVTELRRPANRGRLQLVRGEAQALEDRGRGLALMLDRGRSIEADLAVLAIGNFPPESPGGLNPDVLAAPGYRPDPWAADTLAELDPAAPVLMIGTGLTMVDIVISLLDQGHTGPIEALSRRGLVPHRHGSGPPHPGAESRAFPSRLPELMRTLRLEARRAAGAGCGWHGVIDEIRPFTSDLWRSFSPDDRARFLRHARPWWDVHRHRIAPAVAERIEAARASGQLRIHAGRIRDATATAESVTIAYRRRGSRQEAVIRAARLINCAGPGCDFARIPDPIVGQLLAAGRIRPDPLRLGLEVTASCAVIQQDGAISRNLFAVGPVTKGTFWEMTAVPDIRRQCELLAAHIAAVIAAAGRPAPASPPEEARGFGLAGSAPVPAPAG